MDPFTNILIGAVLGVAVSCSLYVLFRLVVYALSQTGPEPPTSEPDPDIDFSFPDFDAEHDNLHRFRKRNERRTPLN